MKIVADSYSFCETRKLYHKFTSHSVKHKKQNKKRRRIDSLTFQRSELKITKIIVVVERTKTEKRNEIVGDFFLNQLLKYDNTLVVLSSFVWVLYHIEYFKIVVRILDRMRMHLKHK